MRKKFDTLAVHGDYRSEENLGSVALPMYLTSTFEFSSANQGRRAFAGEVEDYIYTRINNPTVQAFERQIALLEGGEAALAFSSGMGAISAVLLALTKADDHLLVSAGLYGATHRLFRLYEEKYGIQFDMSDFDSEAGLRQQIKESTTCIFIETPINPTMQLIDLEMVAKVAKEYGIPVVVDNTFSSPYLQRPLELGCDVVVHSATKYLNGHGDVIAGAVVGKRELIDGMHKTIRNNTGAVLSPFDAWLLMRGIKTLSLRMEKHCKNAEEIVQRLLDDSRVGQVYYPSLDESGIYHKQMEAGGGVIAFELKGGLTEAQSFLDHVRLIKLAVSLGDPESLIEHPASMTHAVIPKKERLEMGISDSLIRLSVGLEAWEDIWHDLDQALDQISK